VVNFTTVACRISSRLKWYKNYKNRLRWAKVIVKNKLPRFCGSLCRFKLSFVHRLHVPPFIWRTIICMHQTGPRKGAYHPAVYYAHGMSWSEMPCRLFFIEHGAKFNWQYCWDILLSREMLAAINYAMWDNFVIQQLSTLQGKSEYHSPTAAAQTLNSIYPELWRPTAQSWTPLTVRFRSDMAMCMWNIMLKKWSNNWLMFGKAVMQNLIEKCDFSVSVLCQAVQKYYSWEFKK